MQWGARGCKVKFKNAQVYSFVVSNKFQTISELGLQGGVRSKMLKFTSFVVRNKFQSWRCKGVQGVQGQKCSSLLDLLSQTSFRPFDSLG